MARKDRSVVNLTGGMDFYVKEGQGSAQLRSPEVTKAGLRLWGGSGVWHADLDMEYTLIRLYEGSMKAL